MMRLQSLLATAYLLLLVLRGPALPTARASGPNILGSGLRLSFKGDAGKAYCLISDPCVHVNVLFADSPQDGNAAQVEGYTIKTGDHTLVIKARPLFSTRDDPTVALSLDGEYFVPSSGGHVVASNGGSLRFERLGMKKGAFLVTATDCKVRMVVVAQRARNTRIPKMSLDVIDWENLNAPHGILGQNFPNKAKANNFAPGGLFPASGSGGSGVRILRGKHEDPGFSDEEEGLQTSAGETVKGFLGVVHKKVKIDGGPSDYATSGPTESDCLFSRFGVGLDQPQEQREAEGLGELNTDIML